MPVVTACVGAAATTPSVEGGRCCPAPECTKAGRAKGHAAFGARAGPVKAFPASKDASGAVPKEGGRCGPAPECANVGRAKGHAACWGLAGGGALKTLLGRRWLVKGFGLSEDRGAGAAGAAAVKTLSGTGWPVKGLSREDWAVGAAAAGAAADGPGLCGGFDACGLAAGTPWNGEAICWDGPKLLVLPAPAGCGGLPNRCWNLLLMEDMNPGDGAGIGSGKPVRTAPESQMAQGNRVGGTRGKKENGRHPRAGS